MKSAIAIGLCALLSGACLYLADDKEKKEAPPATKVVTKKTATDFDDFAPPLATKVVPRKTPAAAARQPIDDVERALEQPTFADFSDTPLSQCLQFLATQANIRIYLDEMGLANAMVDRTQAMTFQMTGVRLSLVLDLMLEPLNLDYAIRENVLFISSKERIDAMREPTVLRLGDVLPPGADAGEAATRIVTMITENVDRDVWIVNGGTNNIQFMPDARALVVTASSRTHRKINRLLNELRSAKVAQGMPDQGATTAPIAAR
jgi:hypothetical protein